MSGAQAVTAQDTTEKTRESSGRWVRLLATVGALVFAYAMWVPWAIIVANTGGKENTPVLIDPAVAVTSGLVKFGSFAPTPIVIAAFSMLGLLLAPLLWRPSDSLLGAIASHIFGLWAIFATLVMLEFGTSPFVSGTPQAIAPSGPFGANGTLTGQLALGFWLAVAALVPVWIAVVGLLVSEWRRHAFWHLPGNDSDAPRSFIQLPGASVLNLGLILWAIGFLIVGWAALDCTQTPLVVGSCQGAPASTALFAGIFQATSGVTVSSATDPNILLFVDPNIAQHAIGILLTGGAILIFLGVWLRAVTRTFCIWTTLWLLAAVALVGLAYSGVGAIIARPTLYGLPAGRWSGESGPLIALLGLALAVVGLGTLAVAALRRSGE